MNITDIQLSFDTTLISVSLMAELVSPAVKRKRLYVRMFVTTLMGLNYACGRANCTCSQLCPTDMSLKAVGATFST